MVLLTCSSCGALTTQSVHRPGWCCGNPPRAPENVENAVLAQEKHRLRGRCCGNSVRVAETLGRSRKPRNWHPRARGCTSGGALAYPPPSATTGFKNHVLGTQQPLTGPLTPRPRESQPWNVERPENRNPGGRPSTDFTSQAGRPPTRAACTEAVRGQGGVGHGASGDPGPRDPPRPPV